MSSQEGPYPAVNTPGLRTRFLGGVGRSLGSRPGVSTGPCQDPSRCWTDWSVGCGRGDWSGDPFPAPVLGPLTISSEPASFNLLLLQARWWGEKRGGGGGPDLGLRGSSWKTGRYGSKRTSPFLYFPKNLAPGLSVNQDPLSRSGRTLWQTVLAKHLVLTPGTIKNL